MANQIPAVATRMHQMFKAQMALNDLTMGQQWVENPPNFGLSIFMEAAEAVDKFNWKWWNKKEADVEGAKMELIDIIHFSLSLDVVVNDGITPLGELATVRYRQLEEYRGVKLKTGDVRYYLEESSPVELFCLLGTLGGEGRVDFRVIGAIMNCLEMSFDDVYKLYMQKALLNKFRQENGYKEGTYVKIWKKGEKGAKDLEDNDVLQGFAKELDWSEPEAARMLEGYLIEAYAQVEKKAPATA